MLITTLQAVRSILTADPSVNPSERNRLLSLMRQGPDAQATPISAVPESRLIRRAECARRLGVTSRTVDNLARTGVLKRVRLPGRTRGAGFRELDLACLINGAGQL